MTWVDIVPPGKVESVVELGDWRCHLFSNGGRFVNDKATGAGFACNRKAMWSTNLTWAALPGPVVLWLTKPLVEEDNDSVY
jgi:hypothetical protein